MKRRSVLTALLTLLLAAFVVWRILWFPCEVDRLHGAIPPQAVFASEHVRLGERWTDWAAHPLVRSVLQAFGVKGAGLDALARDAGTRALVQRLAPRHTVTAYVSSLGLQQEPAWLFASWVGMQGQFMRWGFYDSVLKDFEPHVFSGGRKGWVLRDAGKDFGHQSLALVVTEGMLLGCLSPDPDSLSILVYRVENRVPPIAAFAAGADAGAADGDGGAVLDRLFLGALSEADADRGPLASGVGRWTCALGLIPGGGADVQVRGPATGLLATEAGAALDLAGLGPLLGDAPGMVLVAPAALLARSQSENTVAAATRLLWRELQPLTDPQGQGFAMLATPAYGGRVLGFKVATLVIGLPLRVEVAEADRVIGSALDAFNAQFQTTLVRNPFLVSRGTAASLQSVRVGPLSALGAGERPAYALVDGWFLLASNREALERLLNDRGSEPGAAPSWAAALDAPNAAVRAWVDLEATADAATKIAAVADLLAMAKGTRDQPTAARQNLELARQWIDTLRGLRALHASGGAHDGVFEGRLVLGEPAVAATADAATP